MRNVTYVQKVSDHSLLCNTVSHSELASCLIYARALLEYVIFIVWVRSVTVHEIRSR